VHAAARHAAPQVGVAPEGVAVGLASAEPRCRHSWTVRVEQRWLWRITVHCHRCDYALPMPGRWWRERDVRPVVDTMLDRMHAEGAAWGPEL
jgi:hypothetical protein